MTFGHWLFDIILFLCLLFLSLIFSKNSPLDYWGQKMGFDPQLNYRGMGPGFTPEVYAYGPSQFNNERQ